MFSAYKLLNSCYIITLICVYLCRPTVAISCYECESSFPVNSICLPSCSESDQMNSTCLLTRNIPLESSDTASLRAAHISAEPSISDIVEQNFLFGEEAVYQSASDSLVWDWEYGPITYGCDISGCNDPQIINRLPTALNVRISDDILNQHLTGNLDSSCYQCDTCLNENFIDTNMSNCQLTPCLVNSVCNFVATRSSSTSTSQCTNGWHFTSGCTLTNELAQVDMTLMYYIKSQTHILYQMNAICLSDNCNNITTFQQLKDAITVDPDLQCLVDDITSSTISTTSSATVSTISTSISTTTSPTTTTSSNSSIKQVLSNKNFFILIIFSIYPILKY